MAAVVMSRVPSVERTRPRCCTLGRFCHRSSAFQQISDCDRNRTAVKREGCCRRTDALPLLDGRNPFLLFHTFFDSIDGICGIDVNLNLFSCQCLHFYHHSATESTKRDVKRAAKDLWSPQTKVANLPGGCRLPVLCRGSWRENLPDGAVAT